MKKFKRQIIGALAFIVLLLFMGFSSRGREGLYQLEGALGDVFFPAGKLVGTTSKNLAQGVKDIGRWPSLRRDNIRLEKDLARLREENRNLKDIIGRSATLSNEEAMRRANPHKMVKANVTMKNEGPYFEIFTIDKGEAQGIKKGDTVVVAMDTDGDVATEGLVGYVDKLGGNWAQVRTIIHEGTAVSFRTLRNEDGGVVRGKDYGLEGYAYDLYADMVPGDEVYTSGIGDLFQARIYIGTIDRVTTDEDKMIKNVRIKPEVNFHKLFSVYVITGGGQDE
ncbi:MAG: rod shape-determining protein MreC [Tissierellia bacterium]|nr:rod shape-determining protein MreC [Tissierellia bacterium]